MGRVTALDELRGMREAWRRQGKRVVLTNGCFDLLHVGHVRYLRQAKALGDVLVVGVNDDASVGRLKGSGRPIMGQENRAEMVASLEGVDFVTVFSEDTALVLVGALRPEVYAKGGDYSKGGKEPPEAGAVLEYGGLVELLPLVPGVSTTDLVRQVLDRYSGGPPARGEGPQGPG